MESGEGIERLNSEELSASSFLNVESGEGIERGVRDDGSYWVTGFVESGEGIERSFASRLNLNRDFWSGIR